MKGRLIVIEGVDGSGKTMQTELLVDWLKNHDCDVVTMDFPGYERTPFGCIIGHFLRGEYGDPIAMDPFETTLLYAGDRMHSKSELKKALDNGCHVVLNRYVPSNLAYGCAKLSLSGRESEREHLISFNEKLEYDLVGLPRPDAVLFLDISVNTAQILISKKEARQYLQGEDKDLYESNERLQSSVANEYKRLADERTNYHSINVSDQNGSIYSADHIQKCIQNKLLPLLLDPHYERPL